MDTVTDVRCDENVLNLTVLGIFIRYMYVNAHHMSLIVGGQARESIWLQTRFSLPIGVCIDVNFSCLCDDWQLLLARVNQLHICYCL